MYSSALLPRSSEERQKAEYGRGFTTEAQGKAKVRMQNAKVTTNRKSTGDAALP